MNLPAFLHKPLCHRLAQETTTASYQDFFLQDRQSNHLSHALFKFSVFYELTDLFRLYFLLQILQKSFKNSRHKNKQIKKGTASSHGNPLSSLKTFIFIENYFTARVTVSPLIFHSLANPSVFPYSIASARVISLINASFFRMSAAS